MDSETKLQRWERHAEWPLAVAAVLFLVLFSRQVLTQPQGREGQALRWVSQDELEGVELLPADGPIVAALRLPERLTGLTVGELRGAPCEGMADAMAASDAGADFLVMLHELPHGEVRSICELVPVPVYVRGMELEAAWELGATGVVEGA